MIRSAATNASRKPAAALIGKHYGAARCDSTHLLVRQQRAEERERSMRKRPPKSFHCSTEFTLHVLGGKWKTVILCYLKERPLRYAELRRLIPNLSDKMLTQRLHDLVDSGLVSRRKATGAGGGDFYVLAPLGKSLGSLLRELYYWGEAHAPSFGVSVGVPLEELDKAG
jgi:DNA-binding HxlR family transcriptional regulator